MYPSKDLSFLGMVKLVNYIRAEVLGGNKAPNISSKSVFEDDKYLQPVLVDDALLYSLDDVVGDIAENKKLLSIKENGYDLLSDGDNAGAWDRVIQLEKELERLQNQFTEYRETVSRTLEHRWNHTEGASELANGASKFNSKTPLSQDDDTHYFSSYSTNG